MTSKLLENYISILIYTLLCMFIFNNFLWSIPITCGDDACVYMNYAKNLVEGNVFAYDSRNIPSEGFSSLIFLLLLTPFEYLGINLLFATIFINICSILVVVWYATLIYKMTSNYLASNSFTYIFSIFFLVLLLSDANINFIIGAGFEGLLSPAVIFIAFYLFIKVYLSDEASNNLLVGKIILIFLIMFLSFLVRPENLLVIFVIVGMFLFLPRNKIALLCGVSALILCLAIYLLFKNYYFSDVFPTGFYRKVHPEEGLPGYKYVKDALVHYKYLVLSIAVLIGFVLWQSCYHFQKFNKISTVKLVVYLFSTSALLISVFFLFVVPIVGYGNRYLIFPIISFYFLLAYLIVYLTENVIDCSLTWNGRLHDF